jgi:hypothetical protein
MSESELDLALAALESSADDPSGFSAPFLRLFPVSGAAVSTLGDLLGSETLSASDELAARLDELQFDLGEGPCWDAMNLATPVLAPDLRGRNDGRWPAFSDAILDQNVRSLFAFPLVVGPLRIGAVDLYSTESVDFDSASSRRAAVLADAVGRLILRMALNEIGGESERTGNAFSRRVVHQATGMVIAQLGIPAADAQLIIQGHAFATGTTMMEVAQRIVDADLAFHRGEHGIEVRQ